MKAFIVRPFGTKASIDFENVQKYLIAPALAAVDIQGGTTAPFLEAGNIREDMFQQLLVADVVIADISIHNANVFYELGIRHALQPMRTFLLRAKSLKDAKDRGPEDEVPFDLRTDRYLEYDSTNPAAKLDDLVDGLRQTLASERRDSPVFQMLPNLEGQDRSRFLPVPRTFREDVERAVKSRLQGLLGLLAMEASDFFWASEGLRLVGRAQFNIDALNEAKSTWEELLKLNPAEAEANQRLATIYQRLGDLDASDQALQRVLANSKVGRPDRAEAMSLLARNIKARWCCHWSKAPKERFAAVALQAPELLKAYEKYKQAFQENLDSYYPGINALSLLTIAIELAKKLPDIWENQYDTEEQAKAEFDALVLQRDKLAGAVGLCLDACKQARQRSDKEDLWLEISAADYLFLTGARPGRVASAYESALDGAEDFQVDSVRKQLGMFQDLGLLPDSTAAAMAVLNPTADVAAPAVPARVILFTGHMIDPPGTNPPRFPDALRTQARQAILNAVRQEMARTDGRVVAIAAGACGGDLLFHDVCAELQVDHHMYLPLPSDTFRNQSVSPGGRYWEDLFDSTLKKCPPPTPVLAASDELPLWLSVRKDYSTWQRANRWLLMAALALRADYFTLIALWDGVKTEGVGGTYHLRTLAEKNGAALVTIYTTDLLKSASAPSSI